MSAPHILATMTSAVADGMSARVRIVVAVAAQVIIEGLERVRWPVYTGRVASSRWSE
jgi:hypothetical protein